VSNLEGREIRDLAISPDGRFLTFAMLNPQEVWNIYSVSSRGVGGVIRNTDSNYHTINPSFGTDTAGNVYIYYASNRMDDPRFHIWRVNSGRPFGVTRITWGRSSESYPYTSPLPGGPVLYTARLEGARDSQVWMVNADGTLPTQLRDGEDASFSPDGGWIVFTRKDQATGVYNLWIMKKDGSNLSQITFHSRDWEKKAKAETGKSQKASSQSGAHGKAEAGGTSSAKEPGNKLVGDVHPRWSPDGTRVVFASDRGRDYYGRHNMDIWMISCDGSNLTQLTTNGSEDDYPVWDPSGNYVYFVSNRGFEWNVWRLDVATLVVWSSQRPIGRVVERAWVPLLAGGTLLLSYEPSPAATAAPSPVFRVERAPGYPQDCPCGTESLALSTTGATLGVNMGRLFSHHLFSLN
jgi:dipeptidyl aminopeptidase/acylaminoacyl peptidase